MQHKGARKSKTNSRRIERWLIQAPMPVAEQTKNATATAIQCGLLYHSKSPPENDQCTENTINPPDLLQQLRPGLASAGRVRAGRFFPIQEGAERGSRLRGFASSSWDFPWVAGAGVASRGAQSTWKPRAWDARSAKSTPRTEFPCRSRAGLKEHLRAKKTDALTE